MSAKGPSVNTPEFLEFIERVREGLDRLFGTAGGCHDDEDALDVISLVWGSAKQSNGRDSGRGNA